ncbi:MAG: hypothetical protein PVH54_11475 [Gammaproteobacteria bacterium]|jgi:hypothetical protein
MIGKKNVVFGFLYLVLTAALGPYMVKAVFPEVEKAGTARQEQMSALQLLTTSGFEQDLEPMTADQIARTNSGALLALNAALNAEEPLDAIKGGPHAHGNLEALLNIAAGIVLGLLAVGPLFKQLISWLFLLGALLHSGSLYMVIVFHAAWAQPILASGIGPILLLVALLLMGIAAAIGYRGRFAED